MDCRGERTVGHLEGGPPSAPERAPVSARRFNQDLRRAAGPSLRVNDDQWGYLFRLICSEYPYCTMYGVNILDGSIVSCENIQRSLTFGPGDVESAEAPRFDEFWEALRALCARTRTGRLAELRFNRGRPVSAKTSENGRRFRRLVRPPSDKTVSTQNPEADGPSRV